MFSATSAVIVGAIFDISAAYHIDSHNSTIHFHGKDNAVVEGFIPMRYVEKFDTNRKEGNKFATWAAKLFEDLLTHPRLWRVELLENQDEQIKAKTPFSLVIEVNVRVLEKLVAQKQPIPFLEEILIRTVKHNCVDVTHQYIRAIKHGPAQIPMVNVATQQQPIGLSKSIKLYKYQLDALSWMKSVEQAVASGLGYSYTSLVPWYAAKTSILFDTTNKKCISVQNINEHISKVNPCGGVLGDEMGLGKTAEIISLIVANPGDPALLDDAIFQARMVALEERMKENSTVPEKDANAKQDPHARRAKTQAGKPVRQKLEYLEGNLFSTNATLVVCPSHLAKQWLEEIEIYTNPCLNVVIFNNLRDLKSATYYDIVNADVVIFTHQMKISDNYLSMGNSGFKHDSRRIEWLEAMLYDVWFSEEPLSEKQPLLEHFYWRRIVVDESHEFFNHMEYIRFKSKLLWFVSGTPFTHSFVLDNYLTHLGFPTNAPQDEYASADIFMNNLYWRNTRESIKNEYELPATIEDLVTLDLTPMEFIVYQYTEKVAKKEQYSALAHLQLAYKDLNFTGLSLSQIIPKILGHMNEKIKEAKDTADTHGLQVEKYNKAQNEAEESLKTATVANIVHIQHQINSYRNAVSFNKERQETYQQKVDECTNFLNRLKTIGAYSGPKMNSFATFPAFEEATVESDENKNDDKSDNKSEQNRGATENSSSELPWSEIVDMNLVQLKDELKKRGITPTSKHRKADLQKMLKEAVKQNAKVETTEVPDNAPAKGKRKQPSAPTATAKKPKVVSKDADNKKTTQDKINEQNLLKWWVEMHGTKIGNLLFYIKRLWTDNPSAKILIFSRFSELLNMIADLLYEYDINYASQKEPREIEQKKSVHSRKTPRFALR